MGNSAGSRERPVQEGGSAGSGVKGVVQEGPAGGGWCGGSALGRHCMPVATELNSHILQANLFLSFQ